MATEAQQTDSSFKRRQVLEQDQASALVRQLEEEVQAAMLAATANARVARARHAGRGRVNELLGRADDLARRTQLLELAADDHRHGGRLQY